MRSSLDNVYSIGTGLLSTDFAETTTSARDPSRTLAAAWEAGVASLASCRDSPNAYATLGFARKIETESCLADGRRTKTFTTPFPTKAGADPLRGHDRSLLSATVHCFRTLAFSNAAIYPEVSTTGER